VEADAKERGCFFEGSRDMSYTDGAVVGGRLRIPRVHKAARAKRETIAAIGVADF
jgi:hypothetical protein